MTALPGLMLDRLRRECAPPPEAPSDLYTRYAALPALTRQSLPYGTWAGYAEHVRRAIESGAYTRA